RFLACRVSYAHATPWPPRYSPNYEIVHSRETQSDGTGLTRLIHVALPVPGTQRRDQGSRSARPPSMLELHQKRAQDARGCGKATKAEVTFLHCDVRSRPFCGQGRDICRGYSSTS